MHKFHGCQKKLPLYIATQSGSPRIKNTSSGYQMGWHLGSRKNVAQRNLPSSQDLKETKTQILHRFWLQEYNTDTILEDCYNNEQVRIDQKFVITQDELYSIAWEADSHPSVLEQPILYCEPITFENIINQEPVTQ